MDLNRSFNDSPDGYSTLVVCPSRPTFRHTVNQGPMIISASIKHIVLKSDFWTEGLTMFLETVSMPGLKALTIVARDPADTDGRHNTSFWLNRSSGPWSNVLEAVPKLLHNSACALESFNFTMHSRYREQHVCLAAPMAKTLVQALQAMPELQSLTVIEAISGPPLLAELVSEMMNPSLVPRLETLELVWAEDRHPDESLIPMLASRVGNGEATLGLSSVVLGRRSGGEFMPPVIDHLQKLRKSGVRASLW